MQCRASSLDLPLPQRCPCTCRSGDGGLSDLVRLRPLMLFPPAFPLLPVSLCCLIVVLSVLLGAARRWSKPGNAAVFDGRQGHSASSDIKLEAGTGAGGWAAPGTRLFRYTGNALLMLSLLISPFTQSLLLAAQSNPSSRHRIRRF